MSLLLDLPPELVIPILLHLSPRDITACQLANSSLRALIDNFFLMQYQIATQVAGVETNPDVKLSVYDRLQRLRALEDGWARLNFDFSKKVEVEYYDGPREGYDRIIYDLAGGMFVVGDAHTKALDYFPLPSKVGDKTEWRRIDVDKHICGMGLAIYEHDLIAVIVTTPQPREMYNMHKLEIVLLEFSTGEPHPEAQQPHLFVEEPWMRGEVNIEIVGDTLALVVPGFRKSLNPNDDFYLFDWKTGALKMHVTAPRRTYGSGGLLFLSPTLILLQNNLTSTLEFWDATSTSPFPIGALGLPPLSGRYRYTDIDCKCEPNPVAKGTPYSRQPFRTVPADAIAIFNIIITSKDGISDVACFSMFVHRGTLFGLCPSARDGDGEGEFQVVPWETWGPGVTRWLNADANIMIPTGRFQSGFDTIAQSITTAAGTRAAVRVQNSVAVVIMDFHPARIRRAQEEERDDMRMWGGAWTTGATGVVTPEFMPTWVEAGETAIVSPVFAVPLVSRLPYAARSEWYEELSMDEWGYSWLSMDEERLIVLQVSRFTRKVIEEVVIHHLGATPAGGKGVGVGTSAGAGIEALSINETD